MGCPHTEFRKGQRVIVIFKDGRKLVDKYLQKRSGFVVLKESGSVKLSEVRQISIFRA